MSQLTLGKIATLYGMHRSSVYEAVDKGRVSAGLDGNGQKVIDISEAIRVWGEPKHRPTPEPDNPRPAKPVGAEQPDSYQTPPLMTEATALRLAAALERLIEIEEAKVLRIEHKPGPRPQSFADLLAGLD
jgi:hypothetical protein